MPLPKSLQSYQDCLDAMDKAMADPMGVRVKVEDFNKGHRLRMRMHQARNLDRQSNAKIYEEGHAMHGASVYDPLVVTIRTVGDQHYVYITPGGVRAEEVESLSEVGDHQTEPARLPGTTEMLSDIVESVKRRL